MDTHSFNGRKTTSAAALFIHGRSKFVIIFIHGDDLILPSFRVILGRVSLFCIVVNQCGVANHFGCTFFTIFYGMHIVNWVTSPPCWSFPTVTSLSLCHPNYLGGLSYQKLYTRTAAKKDDDPGFRHGFGAEASLPQTQGAPAVSHNNTRFYWMVFDQYEYHIRSDTVTVLFTIFFIYSLFFLVKIRVWLKI